jgi:hypothetical protein
MKSFNINSIVKVKLTDYGRKVLEIRHNEFWSSYGKLDKHPYIPKTEDENGFVEFQLWELMEKLGNECSLGGELPFETTILIDEKDLRELK